MPVSQTPDLRSRTRPPPQEINVQHHWRICLAAAIKRLGFLAPEYFFLWFHHGYWNNTT
jgi:hypothetical protein